jgi:hypothetical protein
VNLVQRHSDVESAEATWVPKHNEDATAGHSISQAGEPGWTEISSKTAVRLAALPCMAEWG